MKSAVDWAVALLWSGAFMVGVFAPYVWWMR